MELLYKDYEYPSFVIREDGYLIPAYMGLLFGSPDDHFYNENANELSNYVVYQNTTYFDEADIITKINSNEDNYFDFDKAIIDIGANVGCYAFRTFFKSVYAFEPNDEIFQFLNINLILHCKWPHSKTYNVFLSDHNEIAEYDGYSSIQDGINNDHVHYNNLHNVNTHRLDEYDCQNVGLIKVDVEGAEEKVLRGGLGTIVRNNYPPILFELWDVDFRGMTQEKHDSLENFLTSLGYEIYWYWGDEQTHLAIHK